MIQENRDLFTKELPTEESPLAYRQRPQVLADFVGHQKLLRQYPFLNKQPLSSVLLWGPPGRGKTTLSGILGKQHSGKKFNFNAVMGNTAELKKLLQEMHLATGQSGRASLLIIDEIHRLHKAQQDALLPLIESGSIILIGATTENPHICLNKALLSRLQVVGLPPMEESDLLQIIQKANHLAPASLPDEALNMVVQAAAGDARKALNFLEILFEAPADTQNWEEYRAHFIKQSHAYDKNRDRHYDVISAFIKSMRGSDPDAAILWMAVMLEGGEDPVFIARRGMIFAAEDIGNADPRALQIATNGLLAIQHIGMPEARIILSQVVTYLASTLKSNAAYKAINKAQQFLKDNPLIEVPDHLRSKKSPNKKNYLYPHDDPDHFVTQNYLPAKTQGQQFYQPLEIGQEKFLKDRLQSLWPEKSY